MKKIILLFFVILIFFSFLNFTRSETGCFPVSNCIADFECPDTNVVGDCPANNSQIWNEVNQSEGAANFCRHRIAGQGGVQGALSFQTEETAAGASCEVSLKLTDVINVDGETWGTEAFSNSFSAGGKHLDFIVFKSGEQIVGRLSANATAACLGNGSSGECIVGFTGGNTWAMKVNVLFNFTNASYTVRYNDSTGAEKQAVMPFINKTPVTQIDNISMDQPLASGGSTLFVQYRYMNHTQITAPGGPSVKALNPNVIINIGPTLGGRKIIK